eukprot:scaffold2856_cov189-Alexandrium_tamarense.AAC.24
MKVLSALFTTTLLSLIATTSTAAKDEPYVYGRDPKKDAEYDISMGMAGIQQAAQDPKLLAQLFQDMQTSKEGQSSRALNACDILTLLQPPILPDANQTPPFLQRSLLSRILN